MAISICIRLLRAVPQSIAYENDRCLVANVLPDSKRKRRALFSGFLPDYLTRDRYRHPGKGNDKGGIDGLVGYARRNFTVPIPKFRHGIKEYPDPL